MIPRPGRRRHWSLVFVVRRRRLAPGSSAPSETVSTCPPRSRQRSDQQLDFIMPPKTLLVHPAALPCWCCLRPPIDDVIRCHGHVSCVDVCWQQACVVLRFVRSVFVPYQFPILDRGCYLMWIGHSPDTVVIITLTGVSFFSCCCM